MAVEMFSRKNVPDMPSELASDRATAPGGNGREIIDFIYMIPWHSHQTGGGAMSGVEIER